MASVVLGTIDFNCTIQELKQVGFCSYLGPQKHFNCTIQELKQAD